MSAVKLCADTLSAADSRSVDASPHESSVNDTNTVASTAINCPAILIAGIASGQGKTTVTAALARYHMRHGRRVRVFKAGPDFLDPMMLQAASGAAVENLDLWMVGAARSRALLYRAAAASDLILIEGAMGLYDGDPSAADLARAFAVPVAAVIDAGAMAQTFGALALGLKQYQPIPFAGVIANRVASTGHAAMLKASLPADIPLLACIGRAELPLPERHLGLVQASELADLGMRLDALADLIEASGLTALPPAVAFEAPGDTADAQHASTLPRLLVGRRIAVARDDAFSFIYPSNLSTLEAMGATLHFFSPLADAPVPAADALWLPGGYPELHAERLAANQQWQVSVRAFHAAGKPILAECGGMMALTESLETVGGQQFPMSGLIPGKVVMQKRLAALGMQEVALPLTSEAELPVASSANGTLRGHTFHYSRFETPLQPHVRTRKAKGGGEGEAVYQTGNLTASYFHAYFASNPKAIASLFSNA